MTHISELIISMLIGTGVLGVFKLNSNVARLNADLVAFHGLIDRMNVRLDVHEEVLRKHTEQLAELIGRLQIPGRLS